MQKSNKKHILIFLAFTNIFIAVSQNIGLYKVRYKSELYHVDNDIVEASYSDAKYNLFAMFDQNASFKHYVNCSDSVRPVFVNNHFSDYNFKNNVFFSVTNNHKEMSGTTLPQYSDYIRRNNFLFGVDNYFENLGTLSAIFLYRKGSEKGYTNNAVIHPDIYYPYLIDIEENTLYDNIERDAGFKNEVYILKSDYGFKLFGMDLGVGGKFIGEKAHQKTDPRGLNTFSSLGINIGGLKKIHDTQLLSLAAGYIFAKQHLTLRNWQIGRKDKFLPLYGFDHYDLSRSEVLGLYERMYYNETVFSTVAYTCRINNNLDLAFGMDYKYDLMNTEEENSMINLFGAGTHTFSPAIHFTWEKDKSLLFLSYKGVFNKRNGKENIYMPFRPNPLYDIYDYDKIESLQIYNLTKLTSMLQTKYSYRLNSYNNINIVGDISMFGRKESYKDDVRSQIDNSSMFYRLGIGYDFLNGKHELTSLLALSYTSPFRDIYDVYNSDNNLIKTPVSYLTYRYYNKISRSVRGEFTYSYKTDKLGTVGITADIYYAKTKNRKDKDTVTRYNIDETYLIDKGNDLIVNIGLFIYF